MIIVITTDSDAVKDAVVNAAEYARVDGRRTDLRIVDDECVADGAPLSVIAGALIAADVREVMQERANAAVNGFGQDLARAIGS